MKAEAKDIKLEYGWALCPHCRGQFDVSTSQSYFIFYLPLSPDKAFVYLCRNCQVEFLAADFSQQEKIRNRCIISMRSDYSDILSIASELALRVNHWDVAAAIQFGHGLPEDVCSLVINGECDLWRAPDIYVSYAARGKK